MMKNAWQTEWDALVARVGLSDLPARALRRHSRGENVGETAEAIWGRGPEIPTSRVEPAVLGASDDRGFRPVASPGRLRQLKVHARAVRFRHVRVTDALEAALDKVSRDWPQVRA